VLVRTAGSCINCAPLSGVVSKLALQRTGELLPDREVDTSIIYCKKHHIASGEVAPQHLRPRSKQIYNLFTSQQLASWRLHYTRNYPSLASSAAIIHQDKLQKVQRSKVHAKCSVGWRFGLAQQFGVIYQIYQ
jgi:hypothetical protein